MEIIIGILSFLVLGLIYLVYNLRNNTKTSSAVDLMKFSESLTSQIQDIRKEIDSNSKHSRTEMELRLKEINKQINDFHKTSATNMTEQFKESNKVIKDVTGELEKLAGTNKQVLGFANQMKTLEKILANPKQRGIVGETQLEHLIGNVLPPELYQMQYSFKNNETVDAVLKAGEYIIPVDAKFPLANYNKMIECTDKDELADLEKKFKMDIRNRIDETAKYIKPNEGTIDYAYMFIPAQALFQDILSYKVGNVNINQVDLNEYAFRKKVIITSPHTFWAHLQLIVKGYRNLQMESGIKDIIKWVQQLSSHLNAYQEYHQKLGKSLGAAQNHYNSSSQEFKKIDKDITKITSGESQLKLEAETTESIEKSEV